MQVGSFGGLADELETLKRDKNLLMVELVRMRQHQQVRREIFAPHPLPAAILPEANARGLQSSDAEIRKLHNRLEGTEQRQQQMMSFLAKALQNPQFLQQVLQPRAPSRITSGDLTWALPFLADQEPP